MASKSGSCVNLVKTFVRLKSSASTSCVQRAYYTTMKSLPTSLGGSHLSSLPGNRLLLSPLSSILKTCCQTKYLHIADNTVSWGLGVAGIEKLEDFTPLGDEQLQQGVCKQINTSLEQGEAGRLFACVYIRGMQHKVTTEDIIVVKFDFPPNVGDKIRLEKVLAVGGKDFSLIGQPLLSRDIVKVEATVVEKTLSHNRIWMVYRKRKNFRKLFLFRERHTMLVINSIQVAKIPTAEETEEGDSNQDLVKM